MSRKCQKMPKDTFLWKGKRKRYRQLSISDIDTIDQ